MSLTEDLGPYRTVELTASQMEGNLTTILDNLPDMEDAPKTKLLKFSIIEKCLIGIKEATKEMMAARQMGTIQAVDENEAGSRQASLAELEKRENKTTMTMSIDGKETSFTAEDLKKANNRLEAELERRTGQE